MGLSAQRASIIYNPVARGLARKANLLQRSIKTLQSAGIHTRLVRTEGAGTAGGQTRAEIDAGAELIIAAGGDGTINEVASGMLNTGVPLAILPGGTANVLVKETMMPMNLQQAAAAIPNMAACRISVGEIAFVDRAPRTFLCMAGVGLDAEIVSRVDPKLKARAGKFSYYVTGFGKFFTPLVEFEVQVDGIGYHASFALISRVRNYGGDLEIAREASLLRDDFEIVLFRGTDRFRYVPYVVGAFTKQLRRMEGCTFLRGQSVTCNHPDKRVFVQVDGELAGRIPATTRILPDALTILLPPRYLERERRFQSIAASA